MGKLRHGAMPVAKPTRSPAVPLKPSVIQAAYRNLWNGFESAAAEQALRVSIDSPGGRVETATKTRGLSVRSLIYLPEWPYKAKTTKTLDIVVQVFEEFAVSKPELTKSTAQVGYFFGADNAKQPILQMHYDYAAHVDVAHPVFHAQFGKTTWPMDELRDLGFEGEQEEGEDYFKPARIPTAFMGFGQILLMLAADHLLPENYAMVLEAVRKSDSIRWNAECPRLQESLMSEANLHSHHWYVSPRT